MDLPLVHTALPGNRTQGARAVRQKSCYLKKSKRRLFLLSAAVDADAADGTVANTGGVPTTGVGDGTAAGAGAAGTQRSTGKFASVAIMRGFA